MKILLGMSGGLDSTYAARKLIEDGHNVEGAVLVMHEYTEIGEAVESAESIGIPIHAVDCREEFQKAVVDNFVTEYLAARTPNPCIVCNSEVKFRKLLDFALDNGFDAIATGHYARVVKCQTEQGVRYAVARARDLKKDQTYMLWRLPQDILSRLVLPLEDEEKTVIRERARSLGILAADRGESQEICFIPSGDYAEFIERRTGKSPKGFFINDEGKILGEHNGIIRYTVGQRKGLGISAGARIFVTDINSEDNTVTLSYEDSYSKNIRIYGMVFSGISEPKAGELLNLSVKIRYLAPLVSCNLEYLGEGRGLISLDTPVRAVTPGQSAVFYRGDVLACGGFIVK